MRLLFKQVSRQCCIQSPLKRGDNMKINLEIVRAVLKQALGFNSFVASFITEVSEDKSHPTAGITKEGKLIYNPEFVDEYIACKEDLFSLIFHELLHPMFGHFIYGCSELENIAADAIINAVISTVFAKNSSYGNLFRKTHQPKGIDGIMRPDSEMYNSRYNKVYSMLYYNYMGRDSLTTGELIQTLKILTQTDNLSSVLLIGTHGGSKENKHTLPEEVLTKFAEEFRKSAKDILSKQAGTNQLLVKLFVEALQTHLSIRKLLLQKFSTKRKVDKFKELFQERRLGVSPIPINPSKRDIILLSAGIYPCYFHNKLNKPIQKDRGLAIYLDVSGSVNSYLPKILGILKNLRKEISTIFQFSNTVVETSFESLLRGNIKTTYGTDFDCIAKSILENGFDKAVIITDGFASMKTNLKEQLKQSRLITLTILFDRATTCYDFAIFGDVVALEDVCS